MTYLLQPLLSPCYVYNMSQKLSKDWDANVAHITQQFVDIPFAAIVIALLCI